jgi:branched-chain amino acid transport system permease protein
LTISLKALIAAIIGGIGSVPGAFAGGIMIGLAEALWAWLFPIEFRDAALYVGLAILLVLRPTGLFGDNQPAAASTFDKQTTP